MAGVIEIMLATRKPGGHLATFVDDDDAKCECNIIVTGGASSGISVVSLQVPNYIKIL